MHTSRKQLYRNRGNRAIDWGRGVLVAVGMTEQAGKDSARDASPDYAALCCMSCLWRRVLVSSTNLPG